MKILLIDQIAKVNYKYSFSLAQAIKDKGNDVVFVMDQKEENENCDFDKRNYFVTDEKNIGKVKKLLNYISSYHKIFQMLKNEKYDVLHIQWLIFSPVDYLFLKIIKKTTGIKIIATVHDILPFNQKFYDYTYHKKIYALMDTIIVQAENNIKRFGELFPSFMDKVYMIPLGHYLAYGEETGKDEARKKLGISADKCVLLFFGQIKKVKGVGVLLEAFAKVYQQYPDVLLVIAGSVWKDDFSKYQDVIDKYNLTDFVKTDIRYIPDDEVKYYYASADCCVLPYLDVYQSAVLQLTYAYKKPAIATKVGGLPEAIIDHETGFLCEPDNVDDLADTIRTALANRDKFHDMAQRGYEYIKEKFSWDKIADQVIELYRS